ncbi:MAG: hypothetical protein QXR96_01375 [Candidatus Woesearchaeota archaeon]
MLEKAIFRKHTKLILFMAYRKYFSQKELIEFSLKNKDFKDKDSIENKGQFLDKLIKLGLIEKYKYKDFLKKHPDKIKEASIAYKKSHERKRIILEFKEKNLLLLEYELSEIRDIIKEVLKKDILPFNEYLNKIYETFFKKQKLKNNKEKNFEIKEIVALFLIGCSFSKIYFSKYEFIINELKEQIKNIKIEINENNFPLIKTAQNLTDERIRKNYFL